MFSCRPYDLKPHPLDRLGIELPKPQIMMLDYDPNIWDLDLWGTPCVHSLSLRLNPSAYFHLFSSNYPIKGYVDVDDRFITGTAHLDGGYTRTTQLFLERIEVEVKLFQKGKDVDRAPNRNHINSDGVYEFYDLNGTVPGIYSNTTLIKFEPTGGSHFFRGNNLYKRYYFTAYLPFTAFSSFGPDVYRLVEINARPWFMSDLYLPSAMCDPPVSVVGRTATTVRAYFEPFSLRHMYYPPSCRLPLLSTLPFHGPGHLLWFLQSQIDNS